jgi:hypothetical protein
MSIRGLLVIGLVSAIIYSGLYWVQHIIAYGELAVWPVALYAAATIMTFVLYAWVVRAAASGGLRDAKVQAAAWVIPALISLTLIPARPAFSVDVFSYHGHGYQLRSGGNPYAEPVRDVVGTPYGDELARRGWIPVHTVSPYGPLWTQFEAAVGNWTGGVDSQMWVTKSTIVFFHLICGLLISRILGRISPRDRLTGMVLYLWNPVVIWELAGEGHNDSLINSAALLSLLFGVRLRPGASTLAAGAGALVKITAVTVMPPQLVYWWRTGERRRAAIAIGAAGVVLAVLAVLLYSPVWIGLSTFDGMRVHGRPNLHPSTQTTVYRFVTRSIPEDTAAKAIALLAGGAFVLYAVITSFKAVDPQSMVRACGRIAVAYLLLAPGYWPWYATMPVALLALTPRGPFVTAIMAFSLAARFAGPIDRLRLNGLMDWPAELTVVGIVGLWAPALLMLVIAVLRPHLWRRAGTLSADTSGPTRR